ncbi:MAG: ParB/RepB/Spo0J family partition protein [Elusimicrobiota bacterium]
MSQQRLGRGLASLIPGAVTASTAGSKELSEAANSIPIESIKPNRFQPRKKFAKEALEDLVSSIKESGVIQPVLVIPGDTPGEYELVAGERRLRAAVLAGLKSIPAIIRNKMSQEEQSILALIENLQREDLNPLEEAQGYKNAMDTFGLTQDVLAKKVGKSRPYVANIVRLLELPEEVKVMVAENTLYPGQARALLALEDITEIVAVAKRVTQEKLTTREVEEIVNQKKKGQKGAGKAQKRLLEAELVAASEELQRTLGTKVKIVGTSKKGRIVVHYYNLDDLERLIKIFSVKVKR